MEADIVPQFMRGKNIAQTMMRSTSGESFFCYCEPFASCHSEPFAPRHSEPFAPRHSERSEESRSNLI